MRGWMGVCVLLIAAVLLPVSRADAGTGTTKVQWYVTGILRFTLTPNYFNGYGTVPATFGSQPPASPGPGACLQGCAVDFGTVLQNGQYLYKYAAHLHIVTNDVSGFKVYGEGSADFSDGGANAFPVTGSLYYLPSGPSSDSNTGYTPSFQFRKTSGTVNPAVPVFASAPAISYTSYPAAMFTSSSPTNDYYQDYQLKVPASAPVSASTYFVWVVYTVVPQ